MLIFRCIEMNKQILNITELLIYIYIYMMRMTTKTKTSSKQRWASLLLSSLLWGLPLSSEPKWSHQEALFFHGGYCPHPMFLLPKLHCRRGPTTLFPKRLRMRSSPASTPPLTAMIYPLLGTSLPRTASTKISFSHLPSLAERFVYSFYFLSFFRKRYLKLMLFLIKPLQAILEFFGKFIDATSTDMQFVIDDISKEDSSAVGVSWHLGELPKLTRKKFIIGYKA